MGNGHYDDAQRRRAAEEEPTQQPMRERTKPVQRRNPSADQKRVRRQMRREAIDEQGRTHDICGNCGQPVHDAAGIDPGVPWVHSDSGNSRCDVSQPADAVMLRGVETDEAHPMYRSSSVQTVPDSMEQTHTRTVTDDADFDPYLVTRCSDCGETRVCGDRTSQEHYIGAAQQCHNEAGHPDPRRRRAHSRDHLYDGSSCWSCGDDGYYVARPGERESGRTAKRTTMTMLPSVTAGSGGLVDEPEVRHHDPAKSWNVADEEGEAGTDAQSTPSSTTSTTSSMRKGAPFAGYEDFDDCVRQNSDKHDPDAYCGFIKHKVEDSHESAKQPDTSPADGRSHEKGKPKPHDCEKAGYHRYAGGNDCLSCGHRKESALRPLSCRACGHCGQGRGSCALCGSTAVVEAEIAKQATQFDRNVATSDGRVLINPGEQIRTPTGQTVTVNNVRRHETSRDHYYLDTDMGTTLVPWSTNFQVVPSNTRQQELPGYGNPGGNANEMPLSGQNSGHPSNQAPQGIATKCPVCGGSLQQRGDKYQCSRCGYTDQYGGPGGQEFSNATQKFVSSRRDTRSAIARRATEVLDQMKETPL